MKPEQATLDELSTEACLRLLEEHEHKVGRVGFVNRAFPVILPVNYRMLRSRLLLRTEKDTALDRLTRHGRIAVAFQVDALDGGWREGWSVLVQGAAHQILDPERLEVLESLPLRPWAPGERGRFVEIVPQRVSGRRIG